MNFCNGVSKCRMSTYRKGEEGAQLDLVAGAVMFGQLGIHYVGIAEIPPVGVCSILVPHY